MVDLSDIRVAVVGLGYVGLPLAVAFGQHYPTVGFDIDVGRIRQLLNGIDATREVPEDQLINSNVQFTHEVEQIAACNTYIVTVPTPIDKYRRPDMRALVAASETVGAALSVGDIVIYESTVYPGATEEVCAPILASCSGLVFNRDFLVGYSPERINPGDKKHRLGDIKKVTSGSTPEAAEFVDRLYSGVISVGTYRVSNIRVAEAAKVIENTQRDVNIALINELAMIFNRLGIDTEEVLEAAGSKWNFLPFRPGLVGGHCIGVDPYYLTHKAQEIGFHPEMILAGRRINDEMGVYVASRVIKAMVRKRLQIVGSRVLVMGFTFKENCPDLRNTRVVELVRELTSYEAKVDVYDPWVDPSEMETGYGIKPVAIPEEGSYDAVVIAVAHDQFRKMGTDRIRAFGKEKSVIYDVKYLLPKAAVDDRL